MQAAARLRPLRQLVLLWLLVPPPGFGLRTVIFTLPAAAVLVAGIVAESFAEEINVVTSGASFQ